MSQLYAGSCFCGAVQIQLTGSPKVMGYCHCTDCAAWSAAPLIGFSLWPENSVTVTKGADIIGTFNKTSKSDRKFCTLCGGHFMMRHPALGLIDVYPNAVPSFPHEPSMHVHYQDKTLTVQDGLPKFKDLPARFGGSDERLPD